MPRRRTARVYTRSDRLYGDFRDLGGDAGRHPYERSSGTPSSRSYPSAPSKPRWWTEESERRQLGWIARQLENGE